MMNYLMIGIGGAIGSMLRYAVHSYVQRASGATFPYGTLAVNLIGCLLIGCFAAVFAATNLREEYRLGLAVGVLGGFTTFSTFGFETFLLLDDGRVALALTNIIVSCTAGLFAVWLGMRVGKFLVG